MDFAPEAAVTALLPGDRERAIATVQGIAGDTAELSEAMLHVPVRLREALGLAPLTLGAPVTPPGVPAVR